MEQGILALTMVAFGLGALHTLIGPDHYLPFVAMAQTRKWSTTRTLWVVSICGIGHVLSTIVLGSVFIAVGIALEQFRFWEGQRGDFSSWMLFLIGSLYMLWAIVQRIYHKGHNHEHFSDKVSKNRKMTFWILFVIFVFGPCEALAPVLYKAAAISNFSIFLVSVFFAVSTLGVMLIMTFLFLKGFKLVKINKLQKYQHIIAGGTIAACGAAMIFLGL